MLSAVMGSASDGVGQSLESSGANVFCSLKYPLHILSRNEVPTGEAAVVMNADAFGSREMGCTAFATPRTNAGAACGISARAPDTALWSDHPPRGIGAVLRLDAVSCTNSRAGALSVAASSVIVTAPMYGEGLSKLCACGVRRSK